MSESFKKLLIFTRIINLCFVFFKKNYKYSVLLLRTKKILKILISIINLIAKFKLTRTFQNKITISSEILFSIIKILETFQSWREGEGTPSHYRQCIILPLLP